ncbi:hypothetical protein SELMODRAFT_429626 [Selaginella moellendorffii]|uniref:Uncharacterized protein n=1 Tax=Selaginella moellendorffii TaxID=88036 RepID=D8T6T0_SELML|nr:hypothetical protein SELMODRAFT_429626 [Selaginella moellendorffii]
MESSPLVEAVLKVATDIPHCKPSLPLDHLAKLLDILHKQRLYYKLAPSSRLPGSRRVGRLQDLELGQSHMFDPRLQSKRLNVVGVSWEKGFNQVIELSAEILSTVKFIPAYFEEI